MTSADSLSLILRRLDEIKRKLESHDGRVTSVSRPRKGDEAWAAVYSPSTSSNDKITSNHTLTGSGINWAVIALRAERHGRASAGSLQGLRLKRQGHFKQIFGVL